MSAERFTFKVTGPMPFGTQVGDFTYWLAGDDYDGSPVTREVLENLVRDSEYETSAVAWDGLEGRYTQAGFSFLGDDVIIQEFVITLTPVPDVCPECQGVMDSTALAFWAGEDPADYDAEAMTCTGCYHAEHFGTRNPTVRQFHDAGWDHDWSRVFGIRLPGPDHEPVVACYDCTTTFFTARDGVIVNRETEAEVVDAEWITDPSSIKVGELCACCSLVQDTGWNGSEWVTE